MIEHGLYATLIYAAVAVLFTYGLRAITGFDVRKLREDHHLLINGIALVFFGQLIWGLDFYFDHPQNDWHMLAAKVFIVWGGLVVAASALIAIHKVNYCYELWFTAALVFAVGAFFGTA